MSFLLEPSTGAGYASLDAPAFGWIGQRIFSFNEQVQVPSMTMEYWRTQLASHPEWKQMVADAVGYAIETPGAQRRQVVKQVAQDLNRVSSTLDQIEGQAGSLRSDYNALAAGVFGNSIGDDQLTGKGMAYAEHVGPMVSALLQQARQAVANQGLVPTETGVAGTAGPSILDKATGWLEPSDRERRRYC